MIDELIKLVVDAIRPRAADPAGFPRCDPELTRDIPIHPAVDARTADVYGEARRIETAHFRSRGSVSRIPCALP